MIQILVVVTRSGHQEDVLEFDIADLSRYGTRNPTVTPVYRGLRMRCTVADNQSPQKIWGLFQVSGTTGIDANC